ncbi:TIGR00297 family protein [Methanosalsum natronophilum]|uniref:TIGR00297 family protein n=1 Tax=Methanosalsum natronophilum TaxID=768733 RepID=UPI0021698214|nr:TIGR00297 family protein [Methanosalsum natronophilum]MCS3924287.1 uncharacterized protein (TIGR00297 family) [Methanosalsum natronophilum]
MNSKSKRYILQGFTGLLFILFPFINIFILTSIFLIIYLSLKHLPENKTIFTYIKYELFNENERFQEKINSTISNFRALFLSTLILLLIASILEFTPYYLPIFIISSAFALSIFGDITGTIINEHKKSKQELKQQLMELRDNSAIKKCRFCTLPSTIGFLAVGIIAAFIAGAWTSFHASGTVPYNIIFFVSVIGSMTGALFESIPSRIDDMLSVPLSAAMIMWLFFDFGYSVSPYELTAALIFSFFLASLAYKVKIADISALISAAILGVLIIVFSNMLWFVLLLTFFILGGMFTKYRYKYKESIGIAQSKGGVRTYDNVLSNSLTALALAVSYGIFQQYSEVILYAYLGAVATATGDTLASEIGTTAKGKPRMVTNLKVAEPGADGAVSPLGEIAAFFGSAVIGILALFFGLAEDPLLVVSITAFSGFIGTNIDSFMGATLQKKDLLSNSGVNFVATVAGALIAGILFLLVTA